MNIISVLFNGVCGGIVSALCAVRVLFWVCGGCRVGLGGCL